MAALATNPHASFDYQLIETFQAGLVLAGHEVKAIKAGRASLRGAYVKFINREAVLISATISPYQPANLPPDYQPERTIKLLLKQRELDSISQQLEAAGLAVIPTKLYLKDNLIKLEIALARGKKKYDKRAVIKTKEFLRRKRRLV